MKASEFAVAAMNFFDSSTQLQKSSKMRSFESTDGEGSLYMISDPLESHQYTLQDMCEKYAFLIFDEAPHHSIIGNISKYGRNHQILQGERQENEFPYDFLIIVEAPLPVRIWCEDFSDFIAVMLDLKQLFI